MKRLLLSLTALAFICIISASAASAEEKTTEAIKHQTTCPVMGANIDKSLHVDHAGKRIYVCCPGCIGVIKKNPDKYVKELEAKGITLAKAPKACCVAAKKAGIKCKACELKKAAHAKPCCVAAKKAGKPCEMCALKKAGKKACCIAAKKAGTKCEMCALKKAGKKACCVAAKKTGTKCQMCPMKKAGKKACCRLAATEGKACAMCPMKKAGEKAFDATRRGTCPLRTGKPACCRAAATAGKSCSKCSLK